MIFLGELTKEKQLIDNCLLSVTVGWAEAQNPSHEFIKQMMGFLRLSILHTNFHYPALMLAPTYKVSPLKLSLSPKGISCRARTVKLLCGYLLNIKLMIDF